VVLGLALGLLLPPRVAWGESPPITAVPAVVERLTTLYGPATLPETLSPALQKDPLGHLLALQRRQWSQAWVSGTFYDWRTVSKYRRQAGLHLGYDIALPFGVPVSSGWSGVVTSVIPWTSTEYGVTVRMVDGTEVTYGHISPAVSVGDSVVTGQTIGQIAADHVDVKMRDRSGHYLPFGEKSNPAAVGPHASYPKAGRNSILTAWLVAKSSAQQAEEDLFLAQNASQKWALEKRSAERTKIALDRTLDQIKDSDLEGLLSRRRLEEIKAERSSAERTLKTIESRKRASTKQLERTKNRSLEHLDAISAWARSEGLDWQDVEKLIQRTVANDEKLQKQVQDTSVGAIALTLEQLKMRVDQGAIRLDQLEELYLAGGLSRTEIEDQRLQQKLLQEEYNLRRRRNYRP
jgi:Peptidase family M23